LILFLFWSGFVLVLKLLFFLFILYADRKLHWFEEVKYDDIAAFNEKKQMIKTAWQ